MDGLDPTAKDRRRGCKDAILRVLAGVYVLCAAVYAAEVFYPPHWGQLAVLDDTVRWVVKFWSVVLVLHVGRQRCVECLAGLGSDRPQSKRRTAKTTRSGNGAFFSYCSSEMQGWRDAMEDAIVCAPDLEVEGMRDGTAIFAVFDGHGGKDVSAWAAETLLPRVKSRLVQDASSPGCCLKQALLDIDEDLRKRNLPQRDQGRERLRYDFMGCTATVALLSPASVTVANVGDSRVFKCRAGKCVPLSRDHKPESPRERRRIEQAGGKVVKMGPCYRVDFGLNLSRSLGDFGYKDASLAAEDQKISAVADVVTDTIDEMDEFLVVACDGLYELMTWNTVCEYVRSRIRKMPLQEIAEGLLEQCCSTNMLATFGLGTDNESVIIIKFDW